MITNKKKFNTGLGMVAAFTVLLLMMFSPVFGGQNALEYSDELYNSISKDSAYYIPDVSEESDRHIGTSVNVTIDMGSELQAKQTALLYEGSGAEVTTAGRQLEINGDIGLILTSALADADVLYRNDEETLEQKYGYEAQRAIYNWHMSLESIDEELVDQGLFDESKTVGEALEKGIEPSYNYFGIEPEKMSDKGGIVIGSLFFYVFYTVLYGFGLMYMFEGWGLKIGAH
ncbi:hypothetical protein ACFLU3_06235 [Chloroflexota bacterium]